MVGTLNFVLVLVLAFLPSILWLIFFLKEDRHPEPRKLIIFTFCAGALSSIPVLAFQLTFQKFVAQPLHAFLLLILGLALIEEIFKFFAAYWSVNSEPAFDEPVDAIIYAIVAALGFATVENLFIMADKLAYLNLNSILSSMSVFGFRFVGATLLHGLSSAFAGYYWAVGRKIGRAKKFIALGLLAATAIHFAFNWLIYEFEDVSLLYPSLFLVFIALFIFKDFSKISDRPAGL